MKAQQEAPVLLHEQFPAIICCKKRTSDTPGNGGMVSGWVVDGFAVKLPGIPLVVQVVLYGGVGHQAFPTSLMCLEDVWTVLPAALLFGLPVAPLVDVRFLPCERVFKVLEPQSLVVVLVGT